MKQTPARKYLFKREPPDLPGEFEPSENAVWLADGESAIIQEKHLEDIEAPHRNVGTVRIEASLWERAQLAGGQFGSLTLKDVRLLGCDLANVRAHRMTLVRVELIECRLTGFRTTALDWQDVLVQNGDVRYAQFPEGKFRSCEFDGCNCEEADFRNADLTGCVLRSCNLARADLQGARLQNTDLRKSEVEGLLVGINDVRGAIVDAAQAMILARLLGLQIR